MVFENHHPPQIGGDERDDAEGRHGATKEGEDQSVEFVLAGCQQPASEDGAGQHEDERKDVIADVRRNDDRVTILPKEFDEFGTADGFLPRHS